MDWGVLQALEHQLYKHKSPEFKSQSHQKKERKKMSGERNGK
jgi:hypothetical protein